MTDTLRDALEREHNRLENAGDEDLASDLRGLLARASNAQLRGIFGAALSTDAQPAPSERLWLWKNFVGGKPEYWAFDNPYPTIDGGDPHTIGQPCGYAVFKQSVNGRPDVPDEQVLEEMSGSQHPAPFDARSPAEQIAEIRKILD